METPLNDNYEWMVYAEHHNYLLEEGAHLRMVQQAARKERRRKQFRTLITGRGLLTLLGRRRRLDEAGR